MSAARFSVGLCLPSSPAQRGSRRASAQINPTEGNALILHLLLFCVSLSLTHTQPTIILLWYTCTQASFFLIRRSRGSGRGCRGVCGRSMEHQSRGRRVASWVPRGRGGGGGGGNNSSSSRRLRATASVCTAAPFFCPQNEVS